MTSWWTPQAAILVLFIVVVQWSAICVQASSIFCDDSELCLSKRFLRFGRALSADPYYKINGQFYRLNRGYPPYQDKRFLRFGRSQFQGLEDIYGDIPEPYSRKRRSLDTDSQLEVTHDHVRRSADQSTIENPEKDDMSKTIKKRAIDEGVASGVMSKRFMRFGRDFSSNGGGSFGDDNNDIDNNNNDNSQYDKRFMRFGKRPMAVKRFMRFGRNHGMDTGSDILVPLPQNSKRFMRFGKRKNDLGDEIDAENDDISSVLEEEEAKINKLSNVLSLAHRLQSKSGELGGGGGSLYGTQKRFMRFGKRSGSLEGLAKGETIEHQKELLDVSDDDLPLASLDNIDSDVTENVDDDDASKSDVKEVDKKDKFMRFGKRQDPFLRFGKRQDPFLRFGKREAPYLRFGRSMGKNTFPRYGRSDPFLRFGKREGQFLLRFGKRQDPFLRFGKRQDPFLRFGKRQDGFLRFGKRQDPFLRFGKRQDPFLRFGKREGQFLLRFGKRQDPFLRFGKRQDPFLRFGKRQDGFLRFGKRQDPFLRFGKRQDPFLRFGKRQDPFLRFGKRQDPFLRFGKRQDPFLRFGKRQDPFLRFGKRQDPFLRFGKRQDPFLRFGKRQDPFLRFGKSDTEKAEKHEIVEENEDKDKFSSTHEDVPQFRHRRSAEMDNHDVMESEIPEELYEISSEGWKPLYVYEDKEEQDDAEDQFVRNVRGGDGKPVFMKFG